MRHGERISYSLLAALVRGYSEVAPLPSNYELTIRFSSILINVRALARSLQKRPPDRYTQYQLKVLREGIAELLVGIP